MYRERDRVGDVWFLYRLYRRERQCRPQARLKPFAQRLAVIALVGDELGRWRRGRDAKLRNLAIINVSERQEQDPRAAFLVADSLELGVASAFRAADIMSQGPLSAARTTMDLDAGTVDRYPVQHTLDLCQRTANVFPDTALQPAHKAISDCSASSRSVDIGAVGPAVHRI